MRLCAFPLAMLALAGCVPASTPPTPAPAPVPPLAPAPAPVPPAPAYTLTPEPPPAWQDRPLSPGDWTYRIEAGVPTARFSAAGHGASLAISCMPGQIVIGLNGAESDALIVHTSFGQRRLPALGDRNQVAATVAAADPLLDQMAFSRGRFLIFANGSAALVVPAWPELARVVEDCRGQ